MNYNIQGFEDFVDAVANELPEEYDLEFTGEQMQELGSMFANGFSPQYTAEEIMKKDEG